MYPKFQKSIVLAAHGIHEVFGAICEFGRCPGGMIPVVQHPTSGRYYITAGHPGFNTPANNGAGYRSRNAALAASRRLS